MWREPMTYNKTPVTVLQEFLHKRGQVPSYDIICSQSGTHENLFQFKVTACGQSAIGTGKSKKESKHDAAKNLLNLLLKEGQIKIHEVPIQQNQLTSPYEESIKENTIGQLQEFCLMNKFEGPQYETIRDEGLPHDKIFGVRCTVSTMFCDAEARTKKQAKHLAAKEMLKKLQSCSDAFNESSKALSDEVGVSDGIFKKIVELGLRKAGPTVALGKNFKDYFSFFKNEPFPSTEAMDSLKLMSDEEVAAIPNPAEFMKSIIEQMDTSIDVETRETNMHGYVAIANIKTTPEWTVFGMGKSEEESVNKALYNALLFLKDMSS